MEIKTVEMAKCEVCGDLHPAEEMEAVMIKIVKGKACKIGSVSSMFGAVKEKAPQMPFNKRGDGSSVLTPPVVEEIKSEGSASEFWPEEIAGPKWPKKKTLVPPGFKGVFVPAGGEGEAIEKRLA